MGWMVENGWNGWQSLMNGWNLLILSSIQINGGIMLPTYFIFMVKLQVYKLNTIFAKKVTRMLFKSWNTQSTSSSSALTIWWTHQVTGTYSIVENRICTNWLSKPDKHTKPIRPTCSSCWATSFYDTTTKNWALSVKQSPFRFNNVTWWLLTQYLSVKKQNDAKRILFNCTLATYLLACKHHKFYQVLRHSDYQNSY